jgi:acyl-CoA dehydrogenase
MLSDEVAGLFSVSEKCTTLLARLKAFVERENFDAVEKRIIDELSKRSGADRWSYVSHDVERMKRLARADGLWNLFLPKEYKESPGLTNVEVSCAGNYDRELLTHSTLCYAS